MFPFLKKIFASFNPANDVNFVSKQLRKPSGILASKVAKGMNLSNKNLYVLTFKNLKLHGYEKVLEVGFGNGYFFKLLSQKNYNIQLFGVEVSKEMMRQCTKLNRRLMTDKKLEIKLCNGLILPYEDEMFEKAIAINLIYFWENPTENVKELNRVLKMKGDLYIGIRPFDVLSHLPFAQNNFNIQEDDWWIELFEKLGFSLINNQYITDTPLQFNGKIYDMKALCWVFKKSKHIADISNQ